MIQFTIKDWHIWAKKGQDIAPPRLPDDITAWLRDSGINEYGIRWGRLNDVTTSTYHQPEDILETLIVFYSDRDAALFKLRWYEFIAKPA